MNGVVSTFQLLSVIVIKVKTWSSSKFVDIIIFVVDAILEPFVVLLMHFFSTISFLRTREKMAFLFTIRLVVNINNNKIVVLQLMPYILQVVCSWTTDVGVSSL